jgi:plastocyanin
MSDAIPVMMQHDKIAPSKRSDLALVAGTLLATALVAVQPGRAEDAVSLSLTLKDHKFDPAEVHAPAGKPIEFHVKNLNGIVSEFESSDMHFEKIVPAGGEIVVHVRPLEAGRYNFYDDFHRDSQGYLVVP